MTISLYRIRLLDAYAIIKTKAEFKRHVMSRYCHGTLTADELTYLFAKHHLAEH